MSAVNSKTMSRTAVARSADRPKKRKTGDVTRLLPKPLLIFILVFLCVVALIPVVYIFFASVNSDVNDAAGEFFPSQFSLENYAKVWSTVPLASALVNSILVAGSVAVICAILSVSTAYVLVRFAFRGRLTFLRSLIGFQSIPGTLILLPLFVLFSSIGTTLGIPIIGTVWGLILTYLTFALPFSSWVMVTYIRGLPKELEEAAAIDGASPVGILLRIIVPLSWPGIVVSGIFAFLLAWNDVLFASIMTTPSTATAAVVLSAFSAAAESGSIPAYGQIMSAALICAAPVVILYLIFQRYLVSGLTTGGVK